MRHRRVDRDAVPQSRDLSQLFEGLLDRSADQDSQDREQDVLGDEGHDRIGKYGGYGLVPGQGGPLEPADCLHDHQADESQQDRQQCIQMCALSLWPDAAQGHHERIGPEIASGHAGQYAQTPAEVGKDRETCGSQEDVGGHGQKPQPPAQHHADQGDAEQLDGDRDAGWHGDGQLGDDCHDGGEHPAQDQVPGRKGGLVGSGAAFERDCLSRGGLCGSCVCRSVCQSVCVFSTHDRSPFVFIVQRRWLLHRYSMPEEKCQLKNEIS